MGITPVASGFRDEDGKIWLNIRNDMDLPHEAILEGLQVIVSAKQIVSAQAFDLALYMQVQQYDSQEPVTAINSKSATCRTSLAVANARHSLYLGLPVFLLLAPYVALESSIGGLLLIVMAGVSSIAAERLQTSAGESGTGDSAALAGLEASLSVPADSTP